MQTSPPKIISEKEKVFLPLLRQDISIIEGGNSWTGAPTWLLHDGLRNKYFRIDQQSFELLSHWRAISLEKFALQISKIVRRLVTQNEVEELIKFLYANSLTQSSAEEAKGSDWESYYEQSQGERKVWWKKLAHNYIFFRIPLVRPQRFLDFCWPFVSIFFSKVAVVVYALCAILGLLLVQRQWQTFQNTFMDFLTFEGFALYGLSLIFIKSIHELSHAFMSKKYGVDVPIIGAAFIVLMPILYTETTNATGLKDKNKRLMIDFAGIFAELALASIATLLWVFLPDGPLRSIAFTTATLSWVLSLLVNLNPLMRFDGYYILSDFFEIENLQARGFALAKWRLREILFGLNLPPPEVLPKKVRVMVIVHAWATWIYRFFLFLGIAILVYAFFIKIIGALLFMFEILWFILLPIFKELKHWWQIKKEIFAMKRYLISGACLAAFTIFVAAPISSTISVPAIFAHQNKATLFAPLPGKIIKFDLRNGMNVKKGQVLVQLISNEIQSEIELANLEVDLLKKRLSRIGADQRERAIRHVLEQELASKQSALQGIKEQQEKLSIVAPMDGILSVVDPELSRNIWLNANYPIAVIKPEKGASLLGYISENDYARISLKSAGKFIADSGEYNPVLLSVEKLANVASSTISEPYFADVYGGKIPIVQNPNRPLGNGELKLRGGWYQINMKPADATTSNLDQVITGTVILDAEPISFGGKIFKRAASILIRELGI